MRTAYELSDWQGYMTHREIDELKGVVGLLKPGKHIFVNIGAGAGTSTISMLEADPDALIFSVDILASGSEISTNEHLRLSECGLDYQSRVKRIWGDSKLVGVNWPIKVDLVFVDGDHSFAGCMGDIASWEDHVKKGGFMVFHDYTSPNWPDVKIAVDKAANGREVKVTDTLAWYRV